MSAQLNIKKQSAHDKPPVGLLGYGFDGSGNAVKINEDGTLTILGTTEDNPENIIANKGVGLTINTPIVFNAGDVYVTSDTFIIKTAVSTIEWSDTAIVEGQFITDSTLVSPALYQFINGSLIPLAGGEVVPQNFVDFTPQVTPPVYSEGRVWYDAVRKSFIVSNDVDGSEIVVGRNLMIRVYNNSGDEIIKGKPVGPTGSFGGFPTIGLSNASIKSTIQLTGFTAGNIANGAYGYVMKFGELLGVDTSMFASGDVIYIGTSDGELVNERPLAPNYPVRMAAVAVVGGLGVGSLVVDIVGFSGSDTSVNLEGMLNGLCTQTPKIIFSESGGIVYATVTNEFFPTADLPFMIGGINYLLDTLTAPATIAIPFGTASVKQPSWLYIKLNAGVPELATSTAKPSEINAGLSTQTLYDLARYQASGKPFSYRRENNAMDSLTEGLTGAYGFLRVAVDDARSRGSAWDTGQDATPTVDDANIKLALTSGVGKQWHYSNLPLFDGNLYEIYNDITNAIVYSSETNLVNIVTDANGATLLGNNFFYKFKFYYKLNSNGIGNDVIVTRPLGHYSTGALAESDALGYGVNLADTDIEGIVYPLYEMVIQRSGTGGGLGLTVALYSITSLRSKTPGVGGGSGGEAAGTDDKVRVSANDTTNTYLYNKLETEEDVSISINNTGGNETVLIKNTWKLPNIAKTSFTQLVFDGNMIDRQHTFQDKSYTIADDAEVVKITGNQTIEDEKTFSDKLQVNSQAHGGSSVETFSASKTFDAVNGNNQEMIVTAATTIAVTDSGNAGTMRAGVYTYYLPIDSALSPAITVGASFGALLGGGVFNLDDTEPNLITLFVSASGIKLYTITSN